MSKRIFCTFITLFFGLFLSQAQIRSTNETNVILVVHKDSNQITNIELYKDQITKNEMFKKYPNNLFYLGLFKGSYKLNNNAIIPSTGSIITMYTEKILFSESKFLPKEEITIGNIKTRILSSKKGELILKTI